MRHVLRGTGPRQQLLRGTGPRQQPAKSPISPNRASGGQFQLDGSIHSPNKAVWVTRPPSCQTCS